MRSLLLIAVSLPFALPGCSAVERERHYEITAHFPSATELAVGSEVRIGGVTVGSVADVEAVDDGMTTATLSIEPEYAPVSDDAHAILRQTLLDETYVELTTTDQGLTNETEIDEIFEALDPATRESFRRFLDEAGDAESGVIDPQTLRALREMARDQSGK